MVEEVTVTSEGSKPYKRAAAPGLTPLQAGLMYAAGGAALAGPFGLLAGIAAGITAKRGQDNYLDRAARDVYNTRARYQGVQDEIKAELEIADPDEARLLRSAQRTATEGWKLLQSGDETGRALIEQANETIRGIMNADIQARKTEQAAQFNTQRGLVSSAAPALRDQYSSVINQVRDTDARAQRILTLVADKNFDPDKPFSKSVLTELVSSSLGGMFKEDPNGLLNGLTELGSTGSEIGTIVGAIARLGKSVADTDEFKISREEYNRIALNIRQVTTQYGQRRLQEIVKQAQGLDNFARQTGVIPADYSLGDYVSGGTRDLQIAAPLEIPAARVETKSPSIARKQPWQNSQSNPKRQATPPPAQEEVSFLSDDWFRQKIGIPTQKRRRPTN